MSESTYQRKLIKQYEAKGYYVLKIIQANKTGIPDLLCLKQNEVIFAEVKATKGRLSAVQEYRHQELRSLGFTVEVSFEP